MEQKVCRDGDNEMSDNGAPTASILGSRLDHRLRSGVFIFYRSVKMCIGMGEGVSLLRKTAGGRS